MPEQKKTVFLICPVRNVKDQDFGRIKRYIRKLKKAGYSVYWPYRDTDQNDLVGTRICNDNANQILLADEVHIWYDKTSFGSHFDLGVVFALALVGYEKKIVLANKGQIVIEPGVKSFPAVIRALEEGFRPVPIK